MAARYEAYRLAGMARQKLLYHASQTDHDLRCLVLHANLLDNLLIELNVEDEAAAKMASDRDTLPTLITFHSNLHGNRQPVIYVTETQADADASDDEEDEEEEEELHASLTRTLSPPMLFHDTDTETDTDSESEYSDEENEHDAEHVEVKSASSSPTSISPPSSQTFKTELEHQGLSLHRTRSNWSLA